MSKWQFFLLGTAIILAGIIGCQEHADIALTPAQQKKVDQHILSTPPKPTHLIGAVIEDQIKLLGYDLDKSTVKAGEEFTITYYLEALSDKMGDNNMFVHFQGRPGHRPAWMNLDHRPIEGLLPLRDLKKGQFVKDVQRVRIKKEFPSGPATLYWGLFRGNNRLKIKNPKDVKHDKEGRVVVARIDVRGSRPKPLPLATALKLSTTATINIDGKLTEPVWKSARWTPYWRLPNGKKGPAPKTRAKFAWDDSNLYVAVVSQDSDVWSKFTERDSNTWEQEVIELFIDADGDKKDYLELQVTPANVVFDAKFARHRSDLKIARAWNMAGLKTAVSVDGTLNKRDDVDKSWTVEMAVPFAEVPGAKTPPKNGSLWRANLFRWDWPKSSKRQKAAAFSPPVIGDFHALHRFGRIRFVDPKQTKRLGKPGKTLLRPIPIPAPKQDNASLRPSNAQDPKPAKK